MSGLFVTLEGGEGSGKSTLAKALADDLMARGHAVEQTREPGGTRLAEKVRAIALAPEDDDGWSPLAQVLLMNAARGDHLDKRIRPALARGAIVLCDRFLDSTRVYQGMQGGVGAATLACLESMVVADDRPDLTLVLDAPPGDLLVRRTGRAGPDDPYERRDLAFHEAVRAGFLDIARAEPDRCAVLDARLAPDELRKCAQACLDEAIRKKGRGA